MSVVRSLHDADLVDALFSLGLQEDTVAGCDSLLLSILTQAVEGKRAGLQHD